MISWLHCVLRTVKYVARRGSNPRISSLHLHLTMRIRVRRLLKLNSRRSRIGGDTAIWRLARISHQRSPRMEAMGYPLDSGDPKM